MYNEKKNNVTVWVFAAVIVILALLVVFYKSRPAETAENAAEQKTAEQKPAEQPKPAETSNEKPKPAEQPKSAETAEKERRKNAEMRGNEETVGDAIPESNPAEQKESEDPESVEI